mgnify:CR=1 FL=1
MHQPDLAQSYVDRWFLPLEAVSRSIGVSNDETRTLLDCKCAPGPIYAYSENDGWWSALAAYTGVTDPKPPASARQWYSHGAVWWLRRAIMAVRDGASFSRAAHLNAARFHSAFEREISIQRFANYAYPQCFKDGALLTDVIAETAANEWDAWIKGAYGVCLRFFTAESCIRKEALGARIKAHLNANAASEDLLDEDTLLTLCESLAALVLPFAPWERHTGTPGKAIDTPLTQLRLGAEYPYG